MVTLKDIAKEAGVSIMTVSRVINKHYDKVSDENITKIETLVNKYGYVPNSSARSLSSRSSKIISVIIQANENPLASPYNATFLGYLIQRIQSEGYNAMVYFINEFSEITTYLQSWNAEGAIFLGTFDENIKLIQENNRIPLVFTDSYSSIRQLINIGIDDYKGGVLAAEHFIKKGHKEFAFIAPTFGYSQVMQQRLKGFMDTLIRNNFSLEPEYTWDPINIQETADFICSSKKPVTAIFVAADHIAIELIDILKKRGYNIPKDFSFIGFDNLPLSQYTTPHLTTISQDIFKKAQYATEILFQHLRNPQLPTQSMILDVQLVERESVFDRTTLSSTSS